MNLKEVYAMFADLGMQNGLVQTLLGVASIPFDGKYPAGVRFLGVFNRKRI